MTQPGPLLDELRHQTTGEVGRPAETFYQRTLRELRRDRYVDVTKDTQFSEAWMLLALVLTIVGVAVSAPVPLAVASALITVAAVGWLWDRLSLFGLHYKRSFSETRAFLGETIHLTLELSNRKVLPVPWMDMNDHFAAALPVDGQTVALDPSTNAGQFNAFWSLGAFQRVTRHFDVHCVQRGLYRYGPARISTGDGFGLFTSKATLPEEQRILVYPRLYSVDELRLPARLPFGERRSEQRLYEDPLRTAGIRPWQPDDSIRRVNWKATARHGELLSRQYEPSEEPLVMVCLNTATIVPHWQGIQPELLERTISVAASIASLASDMRLPVGLLANGFLPGSDQILRLLPGRSPDQLVHVLELLAVITPYTMWTIEEVLLNEAPRLPRSATLAVVSATMQEGLWRALAELAGPGRQVLLFALAEEPPKQNIPGLTVYHLPHLVGDLISPRPIMEGEA